MKKKVYSIIGLTILCVICCCALTGCSPEQIEGLEDTDLIWIAEEHPLFFQCVQFAYCGGQRPLMRS